MRKIVEGVLLIFTLSLSLILSSCTSGLSGEIEKETRSVKGFSGISLSIAADVYLTQDNNHSLTIEADKEILDKIVTEVSGSTLLIKTERGTRLNSWGNSNIKIHVSMPDVETLSVTGSGDIKAVTPIKAKALSTKITGSGDILISDLTLKRLDASVTGSGDINLSGKVSAEDASVKITGSGDVTVKGVEFKDAMVSISGSGDAYIVAKENLEARILGSGDITYSGNPLVDTKISGSGSLKNK
ncbi:MAG: head GIN domain-containing protein [Bacteroidales bacterium]